MPVLGLVGVPKKDRLFSYAPGESYLIEKIKQQKLNVKKHPKDRIVALSSVVKPSDLF